MKKNILLTVLSLVAMSGSAFAADASLLTPTAGYVIKGGSDATVAAASSNPIGKLSTGVKLTAVYSTTGYALVTKHATGSKKVGTSNDSTAIFFVQEPAATPLAQITCTVGQYKTAFASGWTSM